MDALINRILDVVRQVDADTPDPGLSDLLRMHDLIDLSAEEAMALARPDPSHPYGRRVLLATERVEVMVASWTRGVACAPHDHGGQLGAVKVLTGRSRHRLWRVGGQGLDLTFEHTADPGEVLRCGRDVIHSMGDDGRERGLVTLHLYARSIPHMVVYDTDELATYVVDGGCGAWIPHDQPDLILHRDAGLRQAQGYRLG